MIADLLGELDGLTKMGETFLAAAEVGEVAGEHGERADLCLACADLPSERERLLRDRQRLRMAPDHHQSPRKRPQRIRALRRGRLRRRELDRALERGESGSFAAGLEEVLGEAHVEECRPARVVPADELDRLPSELDRARRRPRAAGELGCPGAEFDEVEPGQLARVRHGAPVRERPLEVRVCLCEAEDRLRLACGVDRGGERLRIATCRLPVRRELRGRRSSAAGELVGQLRVKFLALAGQDRRVDRLGEECVAEAEAAACLVGDENAVLDRLPERVLQVVLGAGGELPEQRIADVASGGRSEAQEALRRRVEPGDALQQ